MKRLLIAVLPLIALSSCSINIQGFNTENGAANVSNGRIETYQIEKPNVKKIDVDIETGDCTVNFGESENVDIVGDFSCRGNGKDRVSKALDNIELKYEIKNDTLYVSVEKLKDTSLKDISFISRTTDLEITLPESFCDFDISTDVGDIKLNGLSGSFDISADVGDINAENIALNGDSEFGTDVGNVNISLADVAECDLEISSDVGNINLDTNGIDYTEKDVSKDIVSKRYEVAIGEKCQGKLSADVGDINIRK